MPAHPFKKTFPCTTLLIFRFPASGEGNWNLIPPPPPFKKRGDGGGWREWVRTMVYGNTFSRKWNKIKINNSSDGVECQPSFCKKLARSCSTCFWIRYLLIQIYLTHFLQPMFHFYTPWKCFQGVRNGALVNLFVTLVLGYDQKLFLKFYRTVCQWYTYGLNNKSHQTLKVINLEVK